MARIIRVRQADLQKVLENQERITPGYGFNWEEDVHIERNVQLPYVGRTYEGVAIQIRSHWTDFFWEWPPPFGPVKVSLRDGDLIVCLENANAAELEAVAGGPAARPFFENNEAK